MFEKAISVVGIAIVVLFALFLPITLTLYTTQSPDGNYRIRVKQKKIIFLGIKEAYFEAHHKNDVLVKRKLLFDGDFLDRDFKVLYPSYRWISNSILAIGDGVEQSDGPESLRILNQTSESFSYLLVETYRDKFVILDVQPGALIDLKFELIGRISCEGESKHSKERFGVAAEFEGAKRGREYFIKIRNQTVAIETPRFETTYVPCCAVDRVGFGRE